MNFRELGNGHVSRGEWNEAASCYQQAAKASPNDAGIQIALGFALSELGQHQEAANALTRAVDLDPSSFDAHYLLGRIAIAAGDRRAASAHFERAVGCNVTSQDAHRNLIGALLEIDQTKAADAAARASRQYPESAEFYFYLALTQERAGDESLALASYEKACSIEPNAHVAHMNAGRILMRQERFQECIGHYSEAARSAPGDANVHLRLGTAQMKLGLQDAAIKSYQRSLEIKPHEVVSHIVASLTGETPDRAPDDYVAQLFDEYAEEFDSHLVGTLKYNTPRQIANLVWNTIGQSGQSVVLDLGCGTGLMGVELVAASPKQMVGVDLSSKMLDKARERNIYSRLERADLVAMMSTEADQSYDMIVAADVFVYVGRLEALYEQAFRLLRPAGLFVFSVEAAPAAGPNKDGGSLGYKLHGRGRYMHGRPYLERLGTASGFDLVEMRQVVCREDGGVPVCAYLVLFRRPP
jgi:predicted TPR repeat methyltransferase